MVSVGDYVANNNQQTDKQRYGQPNLKTQFKLAKPSAEFMAKGVWGARAMTPAASTTDKLTSDHQLEQKE